MTEDIFYRSKSVTPVEMSDVSKTENKGNKHLKKNENKFCSHISSFGHHIKFIFEHSLVTSLPKIVTTKSWWKRIWKSLVFLVCLVGLLYQSFIFLQFYHTYPTTMNLMFSSPFNIVQPALTFCSNNLVRRSVHCQKNYSKCVFHENQKSFCSLYPRYCSQKKEASYKGVPSAEDVQNEKFRNSWEKSKDVAPSEEIIQECKKIIDGHEFNCSIRPFPFVTKRRQTTFCFTVDSQLQLPNSEENVYPNTFNFIVRLNTFPEEYFQHSDPVAIYVVIHDRKYLVNPFLEGSILRGGYKYIAYVSMTEIIRLPFPYTTNCTDYVKLWRDNNGTGPLNEMECMEYCKLNKMLESNKCVHEYISYSPHQEALCEFGIEETSTEIVKECGTQCQPACLEQTYDIKYEEMDFDDLECQIDDENCRTSQIYLKVSFRKFRLTSHLYQPEYKSIELFSYIGGYMGMWLGLSLVSVCDFIESLCLLIYYPVKKMLKTKS